ncbi:MAG: transporter substrate-binding domain-containing protein [Paracoccaceae bacterium]
MKRLLILTMALVVWATGIFAQDLRIATITRPPFSLEEEGKDRGFSIDLWEAVSKDLGREYSLVRVEKFSDMLGLVERGEVDAAVANISVTAQREQVMDFSQPIFESGLQIMVHTSGSVGSIWAVIFSRELILAIIAAFGALLAAGMLMWRFERKSQPYFDLPAKTAMFPAFWWALNLIVNGGFEERAPRSAAGRFFGVLLVVSSLFFVSIFVAKITSVLTVNAIQSSVNEVNDLYGKRVGTIEGSTAANFLEARDLRFSGYGDLQQMLSGFEAGELDAVVFDAPILAYYAHTTKGPAAQLVGPVFLRENYGIALPSGSALAEPINQSLLKLREDGTYTRIYRKWFGGL